MNSNNNDIEYKTNENETINIDNEALNIELLENNNINDLDSNFVLGTQKNNTAIKLTQNNRYYNTLVLGLKGTGKTRNVLPMMLEQDLKNKKVGATVIVSKKDMAYNIYALAKKYKRKINLIKPSVNNEIAINFLNKETYDYDYINEFIINYKQAIKKKEIVIIDMEVLKYKNQALRAISMLLLQLQLDIQETDITNKTPHFLYVDDAHYYLPFLENLLYFSDNYNLGITLFLQSRNQLIKNNKDLSYIVDNNIRNTLLLNSLTIEDTNFYSKRFSGSKNLNVFYLRHPNSFVFEIASYTNIIKRGTISFNPIDNFNEIETKAKKLRMKLTKEKRNQREQQILHSIKNKIENNIDTEIKEESLIEEEPLSDTLNNKEIKGEPKPFDLTSLDKDLDYELIKSLLFNEEKQAKRKISSDIFNKSNNNINYCDNSFNFYFE